MRITTCTRPSTGAFRWFRFGLRHAVAVIAGNFARSALAPAAVRSVTKTPWRDLLLSVIAGTCQACTFTDSICQDHLRGGKSATAGSLRCHSGRLLRWLRRDGRFLDRWN
jgi:hypothetical protein